MNIQATTGKPKPKSTNQKGDEAEKFAKEVLETIEYVTEIHPRTHKVIFVNGKRILISKDNDYHNSFDLKGEREDGMIYAQVKLYQSGKITGGRIADARDKIDKNYPYYFPYQRIQVWMVWREWVKRPGERRHKEFFFRVWQRGELLTYKKDEHHYLFKWDWKEITDNMRDEYSSFQNFIENESEPSHECNTISDNKDCSKIKSKVMGNKKHSAKEVK